MRLITRSDFDGLACAVLLRQVETIDAIEFVHPKDVQEGRVEIGPDDILANLPFVPQAGLWFDHHSSEIERNETTATYRGRFEVSASAARVVFDHYREGPHASKLARYENLLVSVDKSDSAQLTMEDVTRPSGWILLSYVMDPRTSLAYYRGYRISNRDLMMKMIGLIEADPDDPEAVLADPDVRERVDRYFANAPEFEKLMLDRSRTEKNVIVTDLRGQAAIPPGNRFLVYALFPHQNIQVRVFDGRKGEFVVCAVGHSIFNRTSKTDVGKLMTRYRGGGHRGAGTCQLPNAHAESTIRDIVEEIKRDG